MRVFLDQKRSSTASKPRASITGNKGKCDSSKEAAVSRFSFILTLALGLAGLNTIFRVLNTAILRRCR